ncbi:MAG TPA: type IX secretion system membrane protein PorP/SprF [Bacteroidales bacterium]|nr:type IX secretion system membrane protein PorP/SprF [Bacteroidales bacterium]
MNTAAQKKYEAAGLKAALLMFCVLAAPAYAAFEDLGAGARGPGMGNAGVAASEDVYAVHYNAAGLGLISRPQFSAAYTQHLSGLDDGSDLNTSFFGYAHPVQDGGKGTVAGAFNTFTLDGGLYKENILSLGYGRRIYSKPETADLFLGGAVKYLYTSFGLFRETFDATNGVLNTGQADPLLSGRRGHSAFDADLGALYRFNTHYQIGMQLAHLVSSEMAYSSGDSDKLPLAVKAAFNYRSLISNLVLQCETTKGPDGSADNRATVAAERWYPRKLAGDFAVRGALGTGSRQYRQVSLGFSYRNKRMQADYGFSIPLGGISGINGSHRMALTFRFGKGSDPEEALETLMETVQNLKHPEVTPPPSPEAPSVGQISEMLANAETAVKEGRYREAASLTAAVLEKEPESAAAWQTMGIAYLGLEKYTSALHAWNKAYQYEKSPALEQAISGYIQSISKLDRAVKPDSSKTNGKNTALPPEQIEMMLNQGVDLYVKQDFVKATEMFENVLRADPENIEALKALRRLKEEHPQQ